MINPDRWSPLKPHPEQIRLIESSARFRLVPAGRRSGKTERAKRYLIRKAIHESLYGASTAPRYFFAAPTRDQAKQIYWADLKALILPEMLAERPRESDLYVTLETGAEIWVLGMDRPERIEGRPWDGGVLDEYGNMKASAWPQNVRPALSDRRGWCWFIGVPEGRNHYYDLAERAKADDSGSWDFFTWVSADILPADEIESARRDLDELTFLQEYEASFINFQGRAYYVFDERKHCARLSYDPRAPLAFCFDFNVAPGVAAVCQEQQLPSGAYGTGVIGEVWIPRNSNTIAVCNKLADDWQNHQGRIVCYGDATGGAGGAAKVAGSDWELIRRCLRSSFGDRVEYRVPRANPRVRSRVNAVNTRLLNQAGIVRLMIDPSQAPHVKQDIEGVQLLEGGSGEIDKKRNPNLTHLSDCLGYYIVKEFPIESHGSGQTTAVGFS